MRLTSTTSRVVFLLMLIISGFGTACRPVETFEHTVEVREEATGDHIDGALVRAEIGVRNAYEATTDSDGIATLAIPQEHFNAWAKIIITADGYQRKSILAELIEDRGRSVVGLASDSDSDTPAEESEENADDEESSTEVPESPAATEEAEDSEEAEAAAQPSEPSESALTAVPPAERVDFYQSRPEMVIEPGQDYQATIETSKGDIIPLVG